MVNDVITNQLIGSGRQAYAGASVRRTRGSAGSAVRESVASQTIMSDRQRPTLLARSPDKQGLNNTRWATAIRKYRVRAIPE